MAANETVYLTRQQVNTNVARPHGQRPLAYGDAAK